MNHYIYEENEHSSCGVGFCLSLNNKPDHLLLKNALKALERIEHRGGSGLDERDGDGAGIMTSIPYELFGLEKETFAVACLFTPHEEDDHRRSLKVFESTFKSFGIEILGYRDVPVNTDILHEKSRASMPHVKQAILKRPEHCRTLTSFEKLLYQAKQMTRTTEKEAGIYQKFFFASLSPRTIVYKGLCSSKMLPELYPDLKDPRYKTTFALFHRRFSTNTTSTWDKAQPFRMIAHNGEINTIRGNKIWSITREKALGLRRDELITHEGISDSGSLNGIVEALKYRSSIPRTSEILSILMPPANIQSSYYDFWSRAMEPWDGPALVAFCDGKTIGARLDRNGLRPCRWTQTDETFFLCSETGAFDIDESLVKKKGLLFSGSSLSINAYTGEISFSDPANSSDNAQAYFESCLDPLEYRPPSKDYHHQLDKLAHFNYTNEEIDKFITSVIVNKKEPIGSMGDTARMAFFSKISRSFFDFFYQDFAQVTNPPLDYIREKSVTDLRVYLGRKPNIFEPKELIPPKYNYLLDGPTLSLGQMEALKNNEMARPSLKSIVIDICYPASASKDEFLKRVDEVASQAIQAIKEGFSILILSDKNASNENLPIPSIFALRAVATGLNETGRRLRGSLILETGSVKNAHHLACLIGFGATAVCPYLALEKAYFDEDKEVQHIFPVEREKTLIKTLNSGVLRIMAKMGISVLRSYQGSELFSIIGFDKDIIERFFPNRRSLIGGLKLDDVLSKIKQDFAQDSIARNFIYREHPSGKMGETHSLTSKRSRLVHQMVSMDDPTQALKAFKEFSCEIDESMVFLRHYFEFKKIAAKPSQVEVSDILKTFGSGGMSFGAISAESQRDLIEAFREIKGRSNSGEGGENPYFYTEGISANIKQMASGRFGVTCSYLVGGDEVQIKICQGAKPGEGGQLMGPKVTEEIAKARFSNPGVDLISPPPQHDIYSIEDLKELIYEIKQLNPQLKVSVKLVSGRNIGAVAVGVVKAGADVIQISGGDGGTGAASLISMKHAGLPLELGLIEVHHSLVKNGLRGKVLLRADGGLMTAKDIITAAILGADQFDFGKIVLVSQGCIMARICEKNTCPTGIATHDPKFKAKYKGNKDKVVQYLNLLATEIKNQLAGFGVASLTELRGQTQLLCAKQEAPFSMDYFHKLSSPHIIIEEKQFGYANKLNQLILDQVKKKTHYTITNEDRAIPASLSGLYGLNEIAKVKNSETSDNEAVELHFEGSAGQGFGIFTPRGVKLSLLGEANDFVGKGLCGGVINVKPSKQAGFDPSSSAIIGNCALYGATSGELLVYGRGGDRFAVRNSGAHAIIEGVGIHALEYMTGGKIIILGKTRGNIGAGMTGGVLYLNRAQKRHINTDYIVHVPLLDSDRSYLVEKLTNYIELTQSQVARTTLDQINQGDFPLLKFVPIGQSTRSE